MNLGTYENDDDVYDGKHPIHNLYQCKVDLINVKDTVCTLYTHLALR